MRCRPKVANWEGPVVRPTRPWKSVILPGTVKDDLLKDVKNFVSEDEKTWYASRGKLPADLEILEYIS